MKMTRQNHNSYDHVHISYFHENGDQVAKTVTSMTTDEPGPDLSNSGFFLVEHMGFSSDSKQAIHL